ncbi:MAG: ATPase [Spirochaetes bacterium]|uniref:ATPase n=1 Tax=Candidatus Gallitreponema excrementavium TaxID=2840840 RepID=A0A9D9HPM3_9SPIR|nr:ATPase [Candidatus Gallitreponema excrementavium]
MIVPMKKVSLVVLEKEKKQALEKLRKLKLVHVEDLTGNGENLSKLKSTYDMMERAFFLISDIKVKGKDVIQVSLTKEEAVEKASQFLELLSLKKNYEDLITGNTKEIERFSRWGNVDPADLRFLAEKGYFLFLYEIPAEYYSLIPETEKVLKVFSDKNLVRFILVSDNGNVPQDLPSQAVLVTLPSKSTRLLREENEDYKSKIKAIERQIYSFSACKTGIEKNLKILEKEIEFENIYSGMDGEEGEGSLRLSWLTGFVPAKELKKVEMLAKQEKWGFLSDEPGEEDAVPTKLENNKVVSLIYPVSDFLGTVPGYREYDISGWFLLFFSLFFGMIFGDGGYGLLITLISVFAIIKNHKKNLQPFILLLILGLTTTLWGMLTCNWFGVPPQSLPESLKPLLLKLDWNWISNASSLPEDTVTQNLQIFCFTIALVQLAVAHLKGIVRNIRSLKCLGEAGSLFMLMGIYYLVLNMVVSSERFPFDLVLFGDIKASSIMFPLIGVGFGLSFIFSNYEDSVLKSVLESLKNIISVLLGVVNVFSDIVSYIRLWAVGLAGAAIANTVNEMAGPILGGFVIFLGILLLGFGHGLNMILNVLSVIVHGVRLNTLEFSSHLGMTWSGFKYKPFSED